MVLLQALLRENGGQYILMTRFPHGRTHWTEEIGRGDWSIRTETYAEMWSDYENFYVKASIAAFHNEDLVFEKEFNEEIQRLGH